MFKSLFRENILKFYCVSCNKERHQKVPAKAGSPQFFFHIILTTLFLSVLSYPWLHFRGPFAFLLPVGLIFEAITRLKMRAALRCPECHFDPTLYYVNRGQALQQVEERWKEKFNEVGIPFPERRFKKFTSRAARSSRRRQLDLKSSSDVDLSHGNK